jgi:CDP-diacylglycerol--glycerol-3-phosphate 3-phosphatidyltransferase
VTDARGGRVEVSAWNVANALTAVRLALVPVFGWLLLVGQGSAARLAAAAVFALAVATDRLDGEIARRHGLVTDIGKIADPIADKALIGMALVGLSLLGELPWWVTALVLAREVGVTVLRLAVLRRRVMPAGRGGKLKTAAQALAIVLYLLPVSGPWRALPVAVMALAVLLTLWTGLDYTVQALRVAAGTSSAPAGAASAGAASAGAGPGQEAGAGTGAGPAGSAVGCGPPGAP